MAYKRKELENMDNLFTNGKKKFVKYEEGAAMFPWESTHSWIWLKKQRLFTASDG